jgi:hypothetical protein
LPNVFCLICVICEICGKGDSVIQNHFRISNFQVLKSLILQGHFGLIYRELCRRLYSDGYFFVLYGEISLPASIPDPKIRVTLRPMKPEDIPRLLAINQEGLKDEDVLERIRLLRILNSGIRECYVGETDDGFPCHISWLINSSQNEKIRAFYGGGVLPLAPNQVLVEGAFTHEQYQRLGIQKWRRFKFFEKSLAMGAKRVINYVRHDNIRSLKSDKGAGYRLFMIRRDSWRFFRRSFTFKPVPESTSYPLENEQITDLLQS